MVDANPELPNIIAIITGKGPQRDHYLREIQALTAADKLQHVMVTTAWLSAEDYALLLGSADLGVSLHTSSSGVDLPMKVVDMFGTGLPVAGWSEFEAWPELVQEGKNGLGFESADRLAAILEELFGDDGEKLFELRRGAMAECKRRWDDEWMPVAGRLFQLRP
jgi:beta-1,4-mannosyltransferase